MLYGTDQSAVNEAISAPSARFLPSYPLDLSDPKTATQLVAQNTAANKRPPNGRWHGSGVAAPAPPKSQVDSAVLDRFIRFIRRFWAAQVRRLLRAFFNLWCAAQRRMLRAFYVLAYLLGSWGIFQRLWKNTQAKVESTGQLGGAT